MNIGIDLDNVVADFQTTWLEFHNTYFGTTFSGEDMTDHDSSPIMGISREEFVDRIYAFYDSKEFDDIKPEPGAIEGITSLSEKHSLYIVTSRPDRTIPRTREWIDRYFKGQFKKILHSNQFSKNPAGDVTKASLCKDHGISVLIEDAPNYAEEAAEAGILVLLLDQLWNRDVAPHDLIRRVKDWEEIVKEVGTWESERITHLAD